MSMHCAIAIPTFNRARQAHRAVSAALSQSYDDLSVVVVDDGSTDDTAAALASFFDHPQFIYLQLKRNAGTGKAKNVALALANFDAITFHDSDDLPHRDKILLQQRALALPGVMAHECLNWPVARKQAGQRLDVDVVLTHHELVRADGSVFQIARTLSLVDDFFPQLQMAAGPPGDWILVNSGLFRRDVFTRVGGYDDTIEEDRDLRNRIIMSGSIVWVVDRPLLTKIETPDSLTVGNDTNYASGRRAREREAIWSRIEAWKRTGEVPPVALDLADVDVGFVSRPERLGLARDMPMTAATRAHLLGVLQPRTGRVAA